MTNHHGIQHLNYDPTSREIQTRAGLNDFCLSDFRPD